MKSNPMNDYSALPVALDMERLIIFCMPHLLVEAKLNEIEEPLESLKKVCVCDMEAATQTIINFFNIKRTFSENELVKEVQQEKNKFIKEKSSKTFSRYIANSASKKMVDDKTDRTTGSNISSKNSKK